MIPPQWLRMFNPSEFNQLLSGGEGGGVDVEDMRVHTVYSGGYHKDSSAIRLFWKVVLCRAYPYPIIWITREIQVSRRRCSISVI